MNSERPTDTDEALQQIDRAYRRLRNKQFIDAYADGVTACFAAGMIRADAFYKNATPGKLPRYILKSNEYPFTPAGDERLEELRRAGAEVPALWERNPLRMTIRELRVFLTHLEADEDANVPGDTAPRLQATRTIALKALADKGRRRTVILIASAGTAIAAVALFLSTLS
ncbi:MAG: hypothetical protein GVY29_02275 [Spirochaetes bacterium]|jgi:hypothetical protein|nr:hypothetical protein [Spirochaetota bacterium]